MRITIDRCPDDRFELAQARPAPDLAAVVRYAGYVERTAWTLQQREVAAPVVPLIVNLGAPFRVRLAAGRAAGDAHRSFVAGLYEGYADVTALGLPMCELTGRTVELALVAGRSTDELAERLDDAADWTTRIRLLNAFVRRRLALAPAPPAAVEWAWQRLVASGGLVRIGDLARELGWSRKQQAQRFATEIGAPPKTVARILRFVRARRAERDPDGCGRGRLGRPGPRLGLCRSGPSDPRVPGARRRDAAGLCKARSSAGNKSSRPA